MVVGGRAGEGREAFKGKKNQIYNVEEVDQTSASLEDKHNLIISVYLAPDFFPAQRLKSRKNPKREETFYLEVGAATEIINGNIFNLSDDF